MWRSRKNSRRKASPAPAEVWIVLHDESPHNRVLGVFASEPEASQFGDEVEARFPQGVIYTSFRVGYRYDRGPGHVEFGPAGD